MTNPTSIAIIGAGLSSLSLALALIHPTRAVTKASSITIYESRSQSDYSHSPENASGVILTPNGLSVLDLLGIFERIKDQCWTSEYRTFKNRDGETTKKVRVAGADMYGYTNHRIWRKGLQDALREMVEGKGVNIEFEKRFEGVVEESKDRVVFRVSGETCEVGMLFGADGIYSSVRKYIEPDVGPEYMGILGVLAHVRYEEVDWPEGWSDKQFTIQDEPGCIFMLPEDREGTDGMVGLQKKKDGLTRPEWEELAGNKDQLRSFYRESYDEWGEPARRIIDAVSRNTHRLYGWAFCQMPKMRRWFSDGARVVLIGDAAHAMPPSSGQGVNQALEDAWTLSELLKAKKDLRRTLDFWQKMRQERIDDILERQVSKANAARAPQKDRDSQVVEKSGQNGVVSNEIEDMSWLYKPDSKGRIDEWVSDNSV